jgi:hypothetical protein
VLTLSVDLLCYVSYARWCRCLLSYSGCVCIDCECFMLWPPLFLTKVFGMCCYQVYGSYSVSNMGLYVSMYVSFIYRLFLLIL